MTKSFHNFLLFLCFFFCLFSSSFALADVISYGQTINGTISLSSEIDSYTFTAQAGESILISLRDISGTSAFDPNIILRDSGGSQIASQHATDFVNLTATIPSNGTYTIEISDNGSNSTGNYQFTLERLSNPVDTTAIIYGQTIGAAITSQTEQDVYSFTAQAGDKISIPFVDTSVISLFDLLLSLKTLDGTEVAKLTSGEVGGTFTFTITQSGTYYLWITDNNYDRTGNYQITLERLNNPIDVTALSYGQTMDSSIVNQTEQDVYSFTANAGDKISIPFVDKSAKSFFDLLLSLKTSDGAELAKLTSGEVGGTFTYTITQSGTYYLWVMDNNYDNTGNYQITLERLNNPVDVTALTYGQTLDSSIVNQTEQDVYSFTANAGDKISIPFVDTSAKSFFDLLLSLKTADGTEIAKLTNGEGSGTLTATITTSGTYYLWVMDNNFDNTGNYQITLERLNNPVDVTTLTYGQTMDSSIVKQTEQDVYSFTANAGDKISIPFVDTSGKSFFDLLLSLKASDGTEVAKLTSGEVGGTLTATVATSGTYYLWVMDNNYDNTGNYQITLERLNNPADVTTIAYGQTLNNSIVNRTEQDVYSFTANAGDKIFIPFTDTSGTSFFDLLLSLKTADGTELVKLTNGESSGTLITTVAASGTYYLWVMDNNYDKTGNYQFTLERLNNPVDVTPINFDQSINNTISFQTEYDVYSFTAQAGDNLSVPFSNTSGFPSFDPRVSLRSADGAELISATSTTNGNLIAQISNTGVYYIWVNDNNYDCVNCNYQITYTDNFLANISFSPKFFFPENENSLIHFDLSRNGLVVTKIYRAWIDSNGAYQKQFINTLGPVSLPKGQNSIVWMGRDAAGVILPPSAYVFSLEATSVDGQKHDLYDPVYSLGSSMIQNGAINPASFDPYKGEELTINYGLTYPSWVRLLVGDTSEPAPFRTLLNYVSRDVVNNVEFWDGRKDDGSLVSGGIYSVRAVTAILPDNAIVIKSPINIVNLIKANPFAIYPAYGQQANIDFNISTAANVTIEIISPTGALIRTIQTNVLLQAGSHTVSWNGKDNSGKTVVIAGDYKIKITATIPSSSSLNIKEGNITIFR